MNGRLSTMVRDVVDMKRALSALQSRHIGCHEIDMDHLAHVKQRDDGSWDRHPLDAHLFGVSSIAGGFAVVFS